MSTRQLELIPIYGPKVEPDGTVWYSARIVIGNTGGLMNYCHGWVNNHRPPAWMFRYSTGELITTNYPEPLMGIYVFHPSAGVYEGAVTVADGEYLGGRFKINGEEFSGWQSVYDWFGDHEGEAVTVQWTVTGSTIAEDTTQGS